MKCTEFINSIQWIAKPVNTSDVLDVTEENGTENALFVELYKQKRRLD